MAEDLGRQAEFQNQINKLLQERVALQEKLNQLGGGQLGISQQLNSAQDRNIENQERSASGFRNIAEAADESADAQERNTQSADGFFGKLSTGLAAGVGAVVGLVTGFKDIGTSLSALGGLLGSVVSGIFSIGKAIIAIPFAIFDGLVGMANNMAGATTALRQAFEDVRKEFGAFSEGPAKNVIAGFKDMRQSAGNLAGTGLSASRVFGYGAEGMAKMMGAVADIAKGLGPAINLLGDEFGKSAEQAVMFSKGLGLSGEQMGKLMKNAALSGKSQSDMMTEVGSMSLQMAKKFGLSSKDIGRDIADMTGDFATFGNMSVKEMGAASAYARKLGMDMKDLKGVVDKFDDFEGAADSVSQLNQAFGIQLDTMKMMNAENPAERIDMMRNAFFAAGKSIENMTRQEKKLLMAQTGLSESALKNAFAAENQGLAYEDFADAAGDAEENQMSQEEVMLKLAKAIEKISDAGQGFTGIMDAFGKGFMHAVSQDPKMKELLKTIRHLLKAVFEIGKTFGKFFMRLLNGSGIIENLTELFNPKFLTDFNNDIKGILKDLGDWLLGKKDGSPEDIFNNMFDRIAAMFSKKGTAGEKVLGSLGRLSEIFGQLLMGLGSWVAGKIGDFLSPIWEKFKVWFSENWKPMAVWLAKYVFGPLLLWAIVKAVAGGMVMGGLSWMVKKFTGIFKEKGPEAPDTPDESSQDTVSWVKRIVDNINELEWMAIIKAGVLITVISGAFALALLAFGHAIASVAKAFKGVSWKQVGMAFAAVGGAIIASGVMIFAGAKMFALLPMIGMAIIGINAAAVLFSTGMIAYSEAISEVMKRIRGIDFKQFVKFLGVVGLALIATAALAGIGVLGVLVKLAGGALEEGIEASAELFELGMVRYAKAIKKVSKIFSSIDMPKFIHSLKLVGLALVGTVTMVGAGVAGKLLSFVGGALTSGIDFAATFFEDSMGTFADAISRVNNKLRIPADFKEKLAVAGTVVDMTAKLLKISSKSLLTKWFGSGSESVDEAAEFFIDSGPQLVKMIGMIDRINIPSPKKTEATVSIIKDLLIAMSKLNELAPKESLMSTVAGILGGGKPTEMVKALADFFPKVLSSITTTVTSLITIAQGMSKSSLEKARIVADIINSIANLMQGLGPPLKLMVEDKHVQQAFSALSGGGGDVANTTNVVLEGMGQLLDVLITRLPGFVTSVLDIMGKALKGKDPKKVEEQVKIFGKITSAIATAMKSIGGFQKMVEKAKSDKYINAGERALEEVKTMFSNISTLIGPGGSIRSMISNMIDMVTATMSVKDMNLGDFDKVIANIGTLLEKSIPNLMTALSHSGKIDTEFLKESTFNLDGVSPITATIQSAHETINKNIPNADAAIVSFEKIEKVATVLNKTFEAMDNMVIPNMEKKSMFGWGDSMKDKIIKGLKSIAAIIKDGSQYLEGVTGAEKPFGAISSAIKSMDVVISAYNDKYFGPEGKIVQVAEGIAESYDLTYRALMGVAASPMDIDVKLQNFANAMGMGKNTFTIENEKLNFTINVDVKLDAERLSDALSNKKMGKRAVVVVGGS